MGKKDSEKPTYIKLYESDAYKKYLVQKEKITSKYPKCITSASYGEKAGYKITISEKDWKLWLKYKKEITDLLFKPNGSYQKFVWSSIEATLESKINSRSIRGKKTITNW